MPSTRSTSPNIQYCPWCPQVIAFPLAPGETVSCLSTLTEHVMRHHLGRLLNTEACVKINSPHVDTHGPGDTGSGGGFGKAYIPAEYIYAYMCPIRKVFVNVYKDPMDGMWYRLRLRCGCPKCVDEAETKHIEHKVERKVTRDALADEAYWADEEGDAQRKGMGQGFGNIQFFSSVLSWAEDAVKFRRSVLFEVNSSACLLEGTTLDLLP